MRSSIFIPIPVSKPLVATLFLMAEPLLLATPSSAQIAVPDVRVRRTVQLSHDQGGVYHMHGKVSAIDPVAKTVTIANKSGSKTMAFSQYSVVIKNGAAASFRSIAIGDEADGIAGMVLGKFTAISMRFGPFRTDLPYGTPVPNRPGYFTSPYSPRAGYIDVTGMPGGMEAKDPYSDKIFLVPRQ